MTFGDGFAVDEIDSLDWGEFECLIAELFSAAGWETKRVGGKTDKGADVIAWDGRERIAIQAKHRTGRRWVGNRAIAAVVMSLPVYAADRGLVITNATFAPDMRRLASLHGVELWDGRRLRDELLSFCVLCRRRVSPTVRDWCLERPDEFGNRVYCFRHQRRLAGLLRVVPPGRVG